MRCFPKIFNKAPHEVTDFTCNYILHNQKHEPDYAYKNTQGNNPIN